MYLATVTSTPAIAVSTQYGAPVLGQVQRYNSTTSTLTPVPGVDVLYQLNTDASVPLDTSAAFGCKGARCGVVGVKHVACHVGPWLRLFPCSGCHFIRVQLWCAQSRYNLGARSRTPHSNPTARPCSINPPRCTYDRQLARSPTPTTKG